MAVCALCIILVVAAAGEVFVDVQVVRTVVAVRIIVCLMILCYSCCCRW